MLVPFVEEIDALFNKAKKNAKLTGKMVGIMLALGHPFRSGCVSLIGFSLGTQVIKSCLKTLHKIGADNLIQNVTLMGGAASFKKGKEEFWFSIFNKVVNGTIKNVYTKKDLILLFYMLS